VKSRASEVGALNHYYGVFEGELEIKGLHLKRSDTPNYFKNVQKEILEVLKEIDEEKEIESIIANIIKIVKRKLEDIKSRKVDPLELCFTKTASKKAEDYEHANEMKSALVQYKDIDLSKSPGQAVCYVVTDSMSSEPMEKVKVKEKDPKFYDTAYYEDYLYRVVEEILSPFSYEKERIKRMVRSQSS